MAPKSSHVPRLDCVTARGTRRPEKPVHEERETPGEVRDRELSASPLPALRSFICALHSAGSNGQWQDKRQRRIVEAESTAAFIPKRGAVIFSIDEEGDASNILSYADAALSGAQEQTTAKAPAVHAYVNSEAAQPEDGNVIAAKALFGQGWRSGIFERGRAQCLESQDARWLFRRYGDEALGSVALVVLARIALQIQIEIGIAAIESGPVMHFGDCRFFPIERRHGSRKPALAERTSFAEGAGGDSSRLKTRKEFAFGENEPFGFGNIGFSLWQRGA